MAGFPPRPRRNFVGGVGLSYVPRGRFTFKVGNAEIAIARHCRCRSGADVHRRPGCGPARRAGERFFSHYRGKNQISSDLEHNKRYLPDNRTRGKIGVVRFELTMNRAGWVLPGTRIVTIDPELGRVALLLLQQSQPFPAPDNFNLRDATFRVVVPLRFNNVPPEGVSEVQTLDRRKVLECYQADREELAYQRRRAARLGLAPPNGITRTPEGCSEARRQETEQRRANATAD
jgi:hypothetical protein